MAVQQELQRHLGKTRSLRLAGMVLALVLAVVFIFFGNSSPKQGLFIPCFFHKATGLYCPGCGATRGTWKLLHGDIYGALGSNILLPFILGIIGYEIARVIAKILFVKELPPINLSKAAIILSVIVMLTFTILRNLPVEPFCRLAP